MRGRSEAASRGATRLMMAVEPTTRDTGRYDPQAIERKWQLVWEAENTWVVPNPGSPEFDGAKPKSYVLEMLPYPSGDPHVGHLKTYSVGDAIAHFRRRRGYSVVHPMGYDAFGLPAENNAIETGEPPREAVEKSIASFREQFMRWGISIDWTRELGTHQPSYYRWTQWIFLKLYERGLAHRHEAPVHWCPKDQTVLANEQVIDGHCERCGTLVELRQLEQWFFRITEYAQRLLDDFELLESWPENVITMQRNWIGRSEGAEVVFRCEDLDLDFPVFTTRPDTLFGATFFVLAPEHPDLERLVEGTGQEQGVAEYVQRALAESAEERLVNSDGFDGMTSPEAIEAITAWLEERGLGKPAVNYRLRDWLVSRQRYWGCPIPVVYCDGCGIVPVPDAELPVE